MAGAYTGITGLGTLTSLTIDGPLSPSVFFGDWNQDNNWSGIRGTHGYLLTGSNGVGNTGIYLRTESNTHPVNIGANNTNTLVVTSTSATVTGTMSATTFSGSGASLTSLPASQLTGTTLPATIVTSSLTSVGTITSGTWSGSFGAVSGANLTSLNASNLASGAVPGSRLSGSYTGITAVGSLAQQVATSGATGGYGFLDRSGTGEGFVWYSTGADALLYSNRLGINIMGFARTTGIAYLYKGITGDIQYGTWGSMTLYGAKGVPGNVYEGFVTPDCTAAVMWQNTIFGHYRNNATWNFYVLNGTYTPSDARYKRDIQPLQNGMNLIRHITPVTYDPLTENLEDDPETTSGRTHYGFTTQNVLEALELSGETRNVAVVDIGGPDTNTGGDRQYLNHSALMAPMVKAIQELDARLQQLETT
jgi:hypothetical protein